MSLEPEIFVRHMIFIIPSGHRYYPENFRSEAYGLNESHVLVKNPSDVHFWIHELRRNIEILLKILRLIG